MGRDLDVVVAGGSVAGLAFATDAARRDLSVMVAEEHDVVGEPEKCDGLVSLRGLRALGYLPEEEVVQTQISSALIHSPSGLRLAVNASALEVVVLHRSAYDRQLEKWARAAGAEVRTGSRVKGATESGGGVSVEVGGETLKASYYVDATGPSSSPRRGIIPAAKFEVEGEWIRSRVVEVFVDARKYPGFFAWVIPFGRHRAKVGVAGRGINPFHALEEFLADKPSTVLRKVSAPIYIGGPVSKFVHGRRILVGESAGQTKPTTAGGITTSIAGAMAASKWASEALRRKDPSLLSNYQRDWEAQFLKEMRMMLRLRRVFQQLTNQDMEALVKAVATPKVVLALSQSDFDYHASALLGALGLPGLMKVARVVAAAGVKSLLSTD